MKNLTKTRPFSSVEAPIVVECAKDPFEELDDILGEYAHTGKQITRNEITGKRMVVHVGNSSTVADVLELEMLFETGGVGPVEKFKEVEVDADNESEEESDTEGDYTSSSDSEDSNYDPKHDEVFDNDDEHIVQDVDVSMNNLCFTADPKHDIRIGVEVQKDDLDVIDYDSFGIDLDDRIDSERRIQLRELRRIGEHKNKGPNKYYFYLGQQFASKEKVTGRVRMHSVKTKRKLIMVKNDKERVRVRCQGTIPALVPYVATQIDMGKNEISQTKGGPVIRDNSISCKQNIWAKTKHARRRVKREIKACASKFLSDHIIKSLATNPNIPMRGVQDQMQKQFDVRVSKMKSFRAKRIASDKMTGSYREQYSLLREYAQELINQNPCTRNGYDKKGTKSKQNRAQNGKRGKPRWENDPEKLDTAPDSVRELLRAPTEGYAEAIVVPSILAEQFELKHGAARRTINLRNEISNFQQRFDESFHEAWERYKDLLRACPHHGFTELRQLDTFYNALNPADQDSLNAVAGGNMLERCTQDVLTIIENKSKVRNSRNKSVVSQVKSCDANSNSNSEIAKLTHAVNQQMSAVTTAMTAILKQFQATPHPASVKAVEEIYFTCDGAHPYYQCLTIGGNTFPELRDNIQGYVSAAAVNYN
nr:hypothetical protein [Tanacetum cinerariifolium]